MQILKADSWILRLPFVRTSRDFDGAHHELVGVTLRVDPDIVATGFAFVTDFGGGTAVKALLDDVLLPRVQGRSVWDSRALWHELDGITHRLGHGINSFAIAAVDIALWDARAKINGHSLARELGQLSDTVPAYGSGKGSALLDIDELVSLSAGYVDQGFDAVKVRVGIDLNDDVHRVRRLRRELGGDVRIMCDANERLDLAAALSLGRRLAEYDVYWFEEPVLSDDVSAYERLSHELPMAISAGEHLCSAKQFLPFIESRSLAVLQPNACMVGGITEIMRIGDLAGIHGLGFAPHFMSELHVHVAAALHNTTYLEYFPFLDAYIAEPLQVVEGRIVVPTRPGHGIDFLDSTWDRFQTA